MTRVIVVMMVAVLIVSGQRTLIVDEYDSSNAELLTYFSALGIAFRFSVAWTLSKGYSLVVEWSC